MERASLARPTLSVWYFPARRTPPWKYQNAKCGHGNHSRARPPVSWILAPGSFFEFPQPLEPVSRRADINDVHASWASV